MSIVERNLHLAEEIINANPTIKFKEFREEIARRGVKIGITNTKKIMSVVKEKFYNIAREIIENYPGKLSAKNLMRIMEEKNARIGRDKAHSMIRSIDSKCNSERIRELLLMDPFMPENSMSKQSGVPLGICKKIMPEYFGIDYQDREDQNVLILLGGKFYYGILKPEDEVRITLETWKVGNRYFNKRRLKGIIS